MAIKELKETIQELKNNNVTVLISTHMLEMVKDLWDSMFIMKTGKIIGKYEKKDIMNQDIDDIFFELTGGEA
jgi:ABC-type multidrug transport system ATPase subunit